MNAPLPHDDGRPDIAVADTAISGLTDVARGVQTSLAASVDPALGVVTGAEKTIRSALTRASNRAINAVAKPINGLTGELGNTIAMAQSQLSQATNAVGHAAATGQLVRPAAMANPSQIGIPSAPQAVQPSVIGIPSTPAAAGIAFPPLPTMPVQPPPIGNPLFTTEVYVYVRCSPNQVAILSANQAASVGQSLTGQGFTYLGAFDSHVSVAQSTTLGNVAGQQWIHSHCPLSISHPLPPPPPIGHPPPPIGNPPPGTWDVWTNCETGQTQIWDSSLHRDQAAFTGDANWVIVDRVQQTGDMYADTQAAYNLAAEWRDIHCENPPPPPPPPEPPPEPPPPPPCPPCPPPPEPPPPPDMSIFPVLDCPLVVNGQLPAVGSKEWCECIQSFTNWMDAIGNWAFNEILPSNGDSSPFESLNSFVNLTSGILGSLTSIVLPIDTLKDSAISKQSEIQHAWQSLLSAVGRFTVVTGAKLLGLTICRTLLGILRDLEIGWDLAVKATIHIEVALNPLEKLLDFCENWAFQYEIPGIGEAMDCILYQTVPTPQAECWMKMHGANPDVWHGVIDAKREKLTVEEVIEFGRRIDMTDVQIVDALQQYGWYRQGEASARVTLYDELPTIQDHLHWLQRNVFDDHYVKDFSLLDGFGTDADIQSLPDMSDYVQRFPLAGRNFWAAFGHDLHALGMKKEYAANHYAAHWIVPATGQLTEMMQRLRPGRVDPTIEFSQADYLRVLAEQDVAPYFRQRMLATAFRTLPLRQLNQAVQQDRFDRTELSDRWQDIGYSPADAELMADTLTVLAIRQKVSLAKGYTPSLVSELAEYGLMDRATAFAELEPQGISLAEVDKMFVVAQQRQDLSRAKRHDEQAKTDLGKIALEAYHNGTVDRANAYNSLRISGYSDQAADAELDMVDLKNRMETIDGAVKAIHKGYNLGALSTAEVLQGLITVGVQQSMASTYVTRWMIERTTARVAASTGVILRWAKKGIISIANAAIRLANLGWMQGDIDLQLLEIEQEVLVAQRQAQAKSAAALAKAQKAAQAAITASQKQFCKLYSPSKMIRWYAHGQIDEATFRSRLTQCGTDPGGIDLLFGEAEQAKAKVQTAQAAGQSPPPSPKIPHMSAGTLKRLYAERVIDENAFTAGLGILRYSQSDITELLDDAKVAREKKDLQSASKGPTGIEYTGQGHDTSP